MSKQTDHKERFDPSRFHSGEDWYDPEVDTVPVSEVISFRDRIPQGFCRIPIAAMKFFPLEARILNMLAYLVTMKKPDRVRGWYRITTGRSVDFLLDDKDARRRALASLEARGVIEVEREKGKSPHIRLTHDAAAILCREGASGSPERLPRSPFSTAR